MFFSLSINGVNALLLPEGWSALLSLWSPTVEGVTYEKLVSFTNIPFCLLIQCLRNHSVEGVVANITTCDHILQESFFFLSPMSNFCAV